MIKSSDPELKDAIYKATGLEINQSQSVSGGDIAKAFRLETSNGLVFMKVMQGPSAFDILKSEELGLQWLAECPLVQTPSIYGIVETTSSTALLMDYIEPGQKKNSRALGQVLAEMHKVRSPLSGWQRDNYIGRLSQSNKLTRSWPTFWREQRLLPQMQLTMGNNLLQAGTVSRLSSLINNLESQLPYEATHRLHGDLWNGNVIWDINGLPKLIDPSVYAGHREVDLAMMMLFGGFPKEVFESYDKVFPLEEGWKRRIVIYQLYYALVHVNLFGKSYESMVKRMLSDLGL